MRETLRAWKKEWIETNGLTDELEVVVKAEELDEHAPAVYEGSFAEIPEEMLDKKVLESAQIVASSVPEREGVYSLLIRSR
ncbi:MAG: hypothetical protein ACK5MN_02870 [Lachnospiraceae bacterium]